MTEIAVLPWNLFTKPKRAIRKVFIHCSASDNPEHDDVKVIAKWHKLRAMNGVGYHYYIQKDGTIQKGRDLERIPAAQAGHNTATIAICLGGLEKFTEAQFKSLVTLCRLIHGAIPTVTFHGHCEVSKKACPVFDYRRVLGLNAEGQFNK